MPPSRKYALATGLTLLAGLVLATAWLSDDSYITFRTLDNFLHGYGLRWNVAERVQSFSNPLWLFLMVPFAKLSGEVYYTSILVSLACTLGAATLVGTRLLRTPQAILLFFALLCSSNAFTDFSTSGLENPLTHLLLAWLAVEALRPHPAAWRLSLVCALLGFTRLDAVLYALPAVGWAYLCLLREPSPWRSRLHRLLLAPLGFSPLLLWLLFALCYYGFIFPNTYYAKLNIHGNPQLALQGFLYILHSLLRDPVTVLLLVLGSLSALPQKDRGSRVLALGILLNIAYVIHVGGDFMMGRFLTGAYFLSVVLCARLLDSHITKPKNNVTQLAWAAAPLVLCLHFLMPLHQLTAPPPPQIHPNGIANERAWYWEGTALATRTRETPRLKGGPLEEPATFVAKGIGFLGYMLGPKAYIIDQHALSDPLLARLPGQPNRIGHILRPVPYGYTEGNIRQEDVHAYNSILQAVTRGPLWSRKRWQAIWELNTGHYDPLLQPIRWLGHAADLPSAFTDPPAEDGTRTRHHTLAGFLTYGPYARLEAGKYLARIRYSLTPQGKGPANPADAGKWDIYAGGQQTQWGYFQWGNQAIQEILFTLDRPQVVEVRVWSEPGTATLLQVHELEIRKQP